MASGGEARFDFPALGESIAELFPGPIWVEDRFQPSPLLPKDYLLYVTKENESPKLSIYLGYYPGLIFLGEQPHDPEVCYQAQGWELAKGREVEAIPMGEAGVAYVQRLEVAYGEEQREVVFWKQEPDRLPEKRESGLASLGRDLVGRVGRGRRDYAWVRIESEPGFLPRPLNDVWKAQIKALIQRVASCLEGS
jgi:hypothetical protein